MLKALARRRIRQARLAISAVLTAQPAVDALPQRAQRSQS
jgi:hypothetical protein